MWNLLKKSADKRAVLIDSFQSDIDKIHRQRSDISRELEVVCQLAAEQSELGLGKPQYPTHLSSSDKSLQQLQHTFEDAVKQLQSMDLTFIESVSEFPTGIWEPFPADMDIRSRLSAAWSIFRGRQRRIPAIKIEVSEEYQSYLPHLEYSYSAPVVRFGNLTCAGPGFRARTFYPDYDFRNLIERPEGFVPPVRQPGWQPMRPHELVPYPLPKFLHQQESKLWLVFEPMWLPVPKQYRPRPGEGDTSYAIRFRRIIQPLRGALVLEYKSWCLLLSEHILLWSADNGRYLEEHCYAPEPYKRLPDWSRRGWYPRELPPGLKEEVSDGKYCS